MRRLREGHREWIDLRRNGRHPALAGGMVLVTVIGLNVLAGDDLLVSSRTTGRVGQYNVERGGSMGRLDHDSGTTGAQARVIGPDGRLYVASESTDSVLRFDLPTYAYLDTFVTPGSGGLNGPTGLVFDARGDLLVGSFETDEVLKYDGRSGAPLGAFVRAGDGGLNGPDTGMTMGPDGNLYVPSFWNHRVLRYDGATGAFTDTFIPASSEVLKLPRVVRFRDDYSSVVDAGRSKPNQHDAVTAVFVKSEVEGSGLGRPKGEESDGDERVVRPGWEGSHLVRELKGVTVGQRLVIEKPADRPGVLNGGSRVNQAEVGTRSCCPGDAGDPPANGQRDSDGCVIQEDLGALPGAYRAVGR